MLRLGKHTIDAPFYQAGLAGYSDAAMRLVARRHGCPWCVTEAMLDVFLLNGGKGLAEASLEHLAGDHPITGQLMGSHPADIAAAAKVLVSLGYDAVDVNLACPVKKIRKKARGGHLLSDPAEAVAILDAVKQAVGDDVPLTVKLRRGSDDSPEAETRFHIIFEAVLDLGYAGATVHGRTVEQKYLGPSRWAFLRDLVQRYGLRSSRVPEWPSGQDEPPRDHRRPLDADSATRPLDHSATPPPPFLLGGSGDIWTARDIFRMLDETGVHWVSVARGCIGNPWLFRQARAFMAGDRDAIERPPAVHEQRDVLYDHFQLSVAIHGEKRASLMMRKFGIKFARHHPKHDIVKKAFIAVNSLADWEAVLAAHYAHDAPGRPAPPDGPPAGIDMDCESAPNAAPEHRDPAGTPTPAPA